MSVELTAWPTARNDASEERWSKMVRRWMTNGVHADAASQNMAPFADATGLQVKVKPGDANVDGFHAELLTQAILGVATAHASLDRIDRVVLRLDNTSPATISLEVVTGTAASTPQPPALVDTSVITDVPIARISVRDGVSTILAADVTDDRAIVMPRINEPAGVVHEYLGTLAPLGYLLMTGQTVNTADYPALAAARGITAPTMVIPDMRNKIPRGANGDVGAIGGSDTTSLSIGNMPVHDHDTAAHGHDIGGTSGNVVAVSVGGDQQHHIQADAYEFPGPGNAQITFSAAAQATVDVLSRGSGSSFSTVPAFRSLNYIVKAH